MGTLYIDNNDRGRPIWLKELIESHIPGDVEFYSKIDKEMFFRSKHDYIFIHLGNAEYEEIVSRDWNHSALVILFSGGYPPTQCTGPVNGVITVSETLLRKNFKKLLRRLDVI